MAFTKISNADLKSRGATTLPNQPTISAQELKEEFDAPAKEVVAPAVNRLIDELQATTGAASIGAVAPTGFTGDTVQLLLNALGLAVKTIQASQIGATAPTGQTGDDVQDLINSLSQSITQINESITTLNGAKHTHSNKSLLDTYSQTESNLADAVDKKHSHSNKSTLDKLSEDDSGNPTFNGNTIPTSGQTGGFQKYIDQDLLPPSGSGSAGDLIFNGSNGTSMKDLYRYENGAWVKVNLGAIVANGSATSPLTQITVSTLDIGEGIAMDPGQLYIVYEE